jgi:hypothetical protein
LGSPGEPILPIRHSQYGIYSPSGDGRQLKYASNFIAFAYQSIWVSRLIFLDNGSDFCNPNCDHTEITASGTKRFMIEQCGACRKNK